jgi:hypothetical protein
MQDIQAHWAELRAQFRPAPDRVRITVRPSGAPVVVGPMVDTSAEHVTGRRALLVTPTPPIAIEPASRDAWDEFGWRQEPRGRDTVYEGEYRAWTPSGTRRTFPGRILERGRSITAYIADPPPQIKRHPKGPCFQLATVPWFTVHWHRAPATVDDAILYVERILNEVLQ